MVRGRAQVPRFKEPLTATATNLQVAAAGSGTACESTSFTTACSDGSSHPDRIIFFPADSA